MRRHCSQIALTQNVLHCWRWLKSPAELRVAEVAPKTSILTLSAHLPLVGYLKGERPLQQLLYSVGKTIAGVRWMMSTENVQLVVERIGNATIADDVLWVIGASGLLDQAISELDTQARKPEHSLWHFAKIRSVAR